MREISLHILDIAENGLRAGAARLQIEVEVDSTAGKLTVVVEDNGKGMPPEFLQRVTDPFVTTRRERRVGLGLPLLAAACEATGGRLDVKSWQGRGTRVQAEFGLNSIDRAPMGRLDETVADLAIGNPDRQIILRVCADGREFVFDSGEVRGVLDGVPLSSPPVVQWVRQYLHEGIEDIVRLE